MALHFYKLYIDITIKCKLNELFYLVSFKLKDWLQKALEVRH